MAEASNTSEECDPILCYPCNIDGKSRSAHGFCDTCKQYLCQNCFNGHLVPLICRNHVMLDYDSMPKDNVVPPDPLTEQCKKHGRLLEYYCKKHNDVLCSVCVTLNHGNCGASFIPDETKDIESSREISCLRDNMSKLIERVKKNKETADRNKTVIYQLKEETRLQVRHIKEEMVKFFDKLELSIVKEIDQIAVSDLSVMDEILKSCETMETDLQKLSEELDETLNKNQNNKLFVAIKRTEKKIAEFQSETERTDSKNGVTRYRFEPDIEIEHMLKSSMSLGKLYVRRHGFKLKHVRNIKVKRKSDKEILYITGVSVLDEEKVVLCDLCDNRNCSVKLLDTNRNEITSQIKLPSRPFDTALVPRDVSEVSTTRDLIVTMAYLQQLRYIRVTNDQITDTDKVIQLDCNCYGVQVTRDQKILVSSADYPRFDLPGKVLILNLAGDVMREIVKGNGSAQLFSRPYYLGISPCQGVLYVSDAENDTLTSISTRDWSVLSKLEGLDRPRGVTVDRAGSVFFCRKDGTVHFVAATGDRATQILGKEDGLCGNPWAIDLSPEGDRMYVGGFRSDHVQEFRLIENN